MMRAPYRVNAIEMVWSTLADGRWHFRQSIVERIPTLRSNEVISALDFLVKYGFAESSPVAQESFRMIADGPSPIEAADLLRAVRLETDWVQSHSCK